MRPYHGISANGSVWSFLRDCARIITYVLIAVFLVPGAGAAAVAAGAGVGAGAGTAEAGAAASGAAAGVAAAAGAVANPTASVVLVDGQSISVDAYNIAGFNYFKLRGLAAAVDCAVWYDEDADAVHIDTAGSYEAPDGGDGEAGGASGGASGGGGALPAYPTASIIIVNGEAADIEAYNIEGFNYFKLRDFLMAVDIGVWYDNATDTIYIETGAGYDPDFTGPVSISEPQIPLGPAGGGNGAGGEGEGEGGAAGEIAQAQMVWEYRTAVVELVNAERAKVGAAPLEAADLLFEIAQFKSTDMAQNNYFAHESPVYGDLEALFDHFGVDFYVIGENLAKGHVSPEQVLQGWMDSPGHRANILDEDYEYIGIGLVIDGEGTYLWTQTFYTGPW